MPRRRFAGMLVPPKMSGGMPMTEISHSLAVLDRIDQALTEALRLAPEAPAEVPALARPPVPLFDQRLNQWQSCLERVEQQAARAAEELEQDAADLRAWQQEMVRIRETL